MRVAVGQMGIIPGEIEKNLDTGLGLIKKAKADNCDLLLLPEMWTTGFLFKKLKELSKTTSEIIGEIKKLSDDITICGTYVVDDKSDSSKVFNKFFALRDNRVTFEYTKIMLFSVTGEDKYFSRGDINQKNTFKIDDMTFGVSVCYELRFPEFFRRASFNGAIIQLNPAIWPTNRLDHWKTLTKARAIENQVYFLCSNGTGSSGKFELAGNSIIYSPWGEILKNLYSTIGIASIDINLNNIKKARENLPSLKDSIAFFK